MRTVVGVAAIIASVAAGAGARQAARYEVAIVGGRVIDGSGQPPRRVDVAVSQGNGGELSSEAVLVLGSAATL